MIERRAFLRTFGLASLVSVRKASAASARPNILLVIADDLTWRYSEPYGSKEVKTPNIARLAAEGVCFDGMFTATAMCAPTRQQLYTGMFPVRNGAYPNHSWVHDGVRSLPHYFRDLGYRVGLSGKTHFGPAESFPFETVGKAGAEIEPGDARQVAGFMNRDREQPWLLVVASHQPHAPWSVGDPSMYPPDKLTVPPYLVDCPHTRQGLSRYYAEITYLDRQLGALLDLVEESGRKDNTLVIFTSEQGAQLPFAKWTCYDHGLKTAFLVRWPGKVKPGSRRSAMTQYVDVLPTLIEAAGGKPDAIRTGRADALGRTGFDGRSFLPVLLGNSDHHNDYVYGVHTTRGIINGSPSYPIRSVRSKRFKYIRNLQSDAEFSNILTGKDREDAHITAWLEWAKTHPEAEARSRFYIRRPAEELYDLDADPYELRNIAGEPRYAEVQADLKGRLESWMRQQGDQGVETELRADERKPRGGRNRPSAN